jgi:hypothetical protein
MGVSDNNLGGRYYELAGEVRRRLAREAGEWERTTTMTGKFSGTAEES